MAYQNQKVKARQTVAQNQQTQTLGVVTNVPMGDWNSTTQYQKLNTVRSHEATYQAKKSSVGIEPTITQGWQEVWQVVAYDGVPSPNGNYPGMTVGNATVAENDSAGNNIADLFSTVQSDIKGLREDVTNESHFRGMFQSVDALKTAYPTATPNDYAYIVGGNIWIYNSISGWTDSEDPSPNTSVPASNATPLMDGVASSGVSSQYSRGDHRHPSDTSKVNKAGDRMPGNLTIGNGNPLFYSEYSDDNWIAFGIQNEGKNRGLWDRKSGMWLINFDENNNPLIAGQSPLKVNIAKLEPTTANGWTVGGTNLTLPSDGVYLVSVSSAENDNVLVNWSPPFVMNIRTDDLFGIYNTIGVGVTANSGAVTSSPVTVAYAHLNNLNNGSQSTNWTSKFISADFTENTLKRVAYKKLA